MLLYFVVERMEKEVDGRADEEEESTYDRNGSTYRALIDRISRLEREQEEERDITSKH